MPRAGEWAGTSFAAGAERLPAPQSVRVQNVVSCGRADTSSSKRLVAMLLTRKRPIGSVEAAIEVLGK